MPRNPTPLLRHSFLRIYAINSSIKIHRAILLSDVIWSRSFQTERQITMSLQNRWLTCSWKRPFCLLVRTERFKKCRIDTNNGSWTCVSPIFHSYATFRYFRVSLSCRIHRYEQRITVLIDLWFLSWIFPDSRHGLASANLRRCLSYWRRSTQTLTALPSKTRPWFYSFCHNFDYSNRSYTLPLVLSIVRP